jgi:hypothetical protein
MTFAVWWMRRDANRVLLGLLCVVWIVAWFGVAFAVAKIDIEYVHPISAFPGGIYSVAVAIGGVGGLGTAAILRWFRRLTDWRWLVTIALTWPIGCGLSAALLNGAAHIWPIHPFANRLVFDIANALAAVVRERRRREPRGTRPQHQHIDNPVPVLRSRHDHGASPCFLPVLASLMYRLGT